MKTLSIILSAFLILYGMYIFLIQGNTAGIVVFPIGCLSLIIITKKTKRIGEWKPNYFMDK